ncbi:MAG TPA: Hsp20/alpha crystallin family protein [Burkholderiales bacterium]|nr:Hsp20/alpha crystallin family protein [Burkholderiales bacterium]
MANITNYRPTEQWGGLSAMTDPIDDLFRGFFVRPLALEPHAWGQAAPIRIDVSESEKAYRLVAEMPGVRKEDINVSIDGNEVTISAEVKNEKQADEGERTLRSERFYGKVSRTLTLGFPIDEAGAQAKYADGVLELTLPKSEAAMPKRITVN